jgi:serine/threonine-protein kinase
VVVKVLRPEMSRGRDAVARFNLEARAASQLSHPNIVTVYNYSVTDDGTLFLVMEHLEGRSLQSLLAAEAPLAPQRAVAIARQIAAALAEAHRHGVVHRDLKPSNVMVVRRAGTDEMVKVLDFGVAKMEGVDLTATGLLCGTPPYMSPEQFRETELDGRCDLYSLGVVLFEMLTGRLPFVAQSPVGYMQKHFNAPVPRPSEVADRLGLPDALEALVLRTLAKEPGDRPPSGEAMMAELDRAMEPPEVPPVALVASAVLEAKPPPRIRTPLPRVRARMVPGARAAGSAAMRRAWDRAVGIMVACAVWFWSRTGARLRRKRQPAWSRALETVTQQLGLRRRRSLRQRLRRLKSSLGLGSSRWRRWFRP